MDKLICKNTDCRKVYDPTDKDADDSTCSFMCWEKINCKNPPEVTFERLDLIQQVA